MRKILSICLMMVMLLFCISTTIHAADEYAFDLQYTGSIIAGKAKDASVKLIGTNGPTYDNVRIKVDIEGPATPKVIAYDSNNKPIDIAQEGYWGPSAGFPIQGSFTNTTPIIATFPEAGTYQITLSLIDVKNADNVIITKDFSLTVIKEEDIANNTQNAIQNSTENEITNVEELPTTGTTVQEYIVYGILLIAAIGFGYMIIRRSKNHA